MSMKTISLREFSKTPSQHLKRLPFLLSVYNIPVAIVYKYTPPNFTEAVKNMENIEVKQEYTTPYNPDNRIANALDVNTEEKSDYPKFYLGKPLSGKKAKCPICNEIAPVEFANKHYQDKHLDI